MIPIIPHALMGSIARLAMRDTVDLVRTETGSDEDGRPTEIVHVLAAGVPAYLEPEKLVRTSYSDYTSVTSYSQFVRVFVPAGTPLPAGMNNVAIASSATQPDLVGVRLYYRTWAMSSGGAYRVLTCTAQSGPVSMPTGPTG